MRSAVWVAAIAAAGVTWLLGAAASVAQPADRPRVLVTTVEDPITPVIADHLRDGIARAERGGYAAYVVELDTPGGLDTSMRDIIQRVLDSDVAVVVFVTPRGARAASAGALITYAAHVAAMAPGTVIGAATPVDLQGGDIERKVINDAAAYAESLAELRGRDTRFARDSVRRGRSATAVEALEVGVVDLVAGSLDELLDDIDGTEVTVAGDRQVTLRTAGAAVDEYDLGLLRRILQTLADPNVAFLLLSIGTLGVIYELASPGVGVGGIVGGSMIVLALFALSVLPINAVGLLFLALAAALFVAELFAPGIGVFAFLGAGSLLLSGLFLFEDVDGLGISLGVVLPTAVVVGGGAVLAGRIALRSRRAPSTTTGTGVFVDRTIAVHRADDTRGRAMVDGAWWSVRSATPLTDGQTVRVVDVDGLDLVVEPVDRAPAGDPSTPGPAADAVTVQTDEQKGTDR